MANDIFHDFFIPLPLFLTLFMGYEKSLGIDHVYVVHPPTGYEWHEQRLEHVLKEKLGFYYEFTNGTERNGTWASIAAHIPQYFVPNINELLPSGVVDCTLRHILFYQRMVERCDKMALILENDPCPMRNFTEMLAKITAEAKNLPAGIFISLENTTLRFPPRRAICSGQYLYKADYGRCAGAYILDLEAAKNIMARLRNRKCGMVVDHWHNEMARDGVFTIYWAHPPCIEQGSHNGKTISGAISTKRKGMQRRISWLLQKFYKQRLLRLLR
jgi:glycosyl transferase family 25